MRGVFRGPQEGMGACEIILLPSEDRKISVRMGRSGMPSRGWLTGMANRSPAASD